MKKRILSLLLVLLLASNLVLSASADAYFPDERPEYEITTAHLYNETCYPLNVFLSNFVEIGMAEYTTSSPDSQCIAAILKHLEINAKFFSSDVTQIIGEDGKPYMRVSESIFNTRMQKLFGRSVPASACPGYEDGYITVSADHFGGPIQVFASVTNCEHDPTLHTQYDTYALYRVNFDVFLVNQDFPNWHSTANQNLPMGKLTKLGSGEALVCEDRYHTIDDISSSAFDLMEFSMNAQGIPCAGANLPYGAEETEPPTQAPTEAPTQAPTDAPTQPETEPIQIQPAKDFEKEPAGMGTGTLVVIIALVVVIALLSLIVILLLFKKK